MSPERWTQVQALFHDLVDLPDAVRAARLAALEDASLRAQVDALLHADADPPSLFDAGVDALATLIDDAPAVVRDDRIGPYRVVGRVGAGGMGTVYRAVRDDLDTEVALKLMRDPFPSPDAVRRFLQERRLLARLVHPNVARLLDAGMTDGGAPYFVMEFVDGVPITDYADAHRLSVDARLRLFQDVCEAVDYAHRNLVVHRDLKPSNVLVTADGTVKLLDFGVAKLLGDASDGAPLSASTTLTQTGARIMTPAYAAPEQVRAEAVTTATDVYALGVLLYTLLSGARPYDLDGLSPVELERRVCDLVPPRPSSTPVGTPEAEARSTTPDRLQRRLRGDVDAVVMTALHKEPARRYASAAPLRADVDRLLDARPVAARPNTTGYRLRTFLRRNRRWVAAASIVVLAFATLAGFYTTRLHTERDRAQASARTAEQVTAFTIDLFERADPNVARGEVVTVREVLDAGAVRIRDELADDPRLRARMLEVIGQMYVRLGLYDDAAPILETALAERQAVDPQTTAANVLPVTAATMSMAQNLYYRGNEGDNDRAEALLRQVIDVRERYLGRTDTAVVEAKRNLAHVLQVSRNATEAEALFREVLDLRRQRFGERHRNLAISLGDLGIFLHDVKGDTAEAARLLQQSIAMQTDLLGPHHTEVARNKVELALIRAKQQRFDEAVRLQRDAHATMVDLVGPTHYDAIAVHHNLGRILRQKGDYAAAEAVHREVISLLDAAQGNPDFGIAASHHNLGLVLMAQARCDDAEAHYRQAVTLFGGLVGPDHPRVAEIESALGACLQTLGRTGEAEALLRSSLATLEATYGPDAPATQTARSRLDRLRGI